MTVLVLVETDAGGATEVSRETLTLRARARRGRRRRAGRRRRPCRSPRPASSAAYGVSTVHHADGRAVTFYAAAAVGRRRSCWPRRSARSSLAGRHAPRQRGAGPRRVPARRGDGGQRRAVDSARTAGRVPPGARRCRPRGDAALDDGRRCSRSPVTPCEPGAGGAATTPVVRRRSTVDVAAADLRARVVSHRGGGARRLRQPEVRAGRGRRRPRRRRSADGFERPARADRAARRLARRLARRDQPRLAPAPRAGRPDRQPDRARPLRPVRHQRRDPALGRLLESRRRSWRSTPTPRRRW